MLDQPHPRENRADLIVVLPLLMLLEGEEPESLAGESEEVLLLEGEEDEESAEEGVWEERPPTPPPTPQWSSLSEESEESPVNGTDRIWLARCQNKGQVSTTTLEAVDLANTAIANHRLL